MKLGYDYIEIETDDIVLFLKNARKHHLIIINLKQTDKNIFHFYTPVYQRLTVRKLNLTIKKSIGIFHYLLCLFHLKHLFFTVSFIAGLFGCCQVIYDFDIEGTNPEVNLKLDQFLHQQIDAFHPLLSYHEINELYDQIKNKFADKIDYLNIYQNGGIVHVRYTNAVINHTKELSFKDYIAKKDGVICQIDVKKGNVVVKLNQFVKKGELLISHQLEDTSQEIKIIPTEGNIYAYTYQRYQASMKLTKMTKAECFDYLLFEIRSKLPSNIKIDKEKVVSYDIIDNKLVLEMQYVFIENIAVKEKE
ncbi:sporulation protein YqfD [[Clostridium] spiroforme]|nr:sporulation protein YqfD [Thomasclavelia spiroformis]MBM6880111.1 sporulation protein YqfD [Thomasclavelia spiroformis]